MGTGLSREAFDAAMDDAIHDLMTTGRTSIAIWDVTLDEPAEQPPVDLADILRGGSLLDLLARADRDGTTFKLYDGPRLVALIEPTERHPPRHHR